MSTINQRAAFAQFELEKKAARDKQAAKKNTKQGAKKMTPVSRKGKNKFKY